MNTLYAFLLWAVVVTAFFEPENSELAEMQSKHHCTTPKSSQTTALTHNEFFSNEHFLSPIAQIFKKQQKPLHLQFGG
jgi:hypothetical protein